MSNDNIKRIIKEALTGGMETPASITQVVKYSDTPLIKDIIKYFEDNEGTLINIQGNGDIWQMDIRCDVEVGANNQDSRDIAIAYAHSVKKDLEEAILEEGHNVPNMSIQGIKAIDGKLDFTIGFVYAYKANNRDLYEQKKRANELLKNIYKDIK